MVNLGNLHHVTPFQAHVFRAVARLQNRAKIDDLARIPFAARALAFDGTNFWTNHREQNQIVSFARPVTR